MKLYEIPNHSWIIIKEAWASVPIAHRKMVPQETIFFDHLDGMYSFCLDKEGKPVHISNSTEVEVIEDHKVLRELITWGGRGINRDQKVPTIYKVKDISDSHLAALIPYFKGREIRPDILKTITEEVQYRIDNKIKVSDYEL